MKTCFLLRVLFSEENDGDGEEGTYFVDQAGHYYFQAKGDSQPVMTVLPGLTSASGTDGSFVLNQENEEDAEEGEEVGLRFEMF